MRYAYQAYLYLQHFEFMSFCRLDKAYAASGIKNAHFVNNLKRGGFSLRRYFLLQHKVILNTHFHIPVIQAIAQRTAIALFPPFIGSKKEIHPCNGPSLTR